MTRDTKLNVLFVDDEKRILDGLRRQFRNRRGEWEMRFADSGESALRLLEEAPADIVVSDMRMPGVTGADLLREVRLRWPGTVRFILSGQTDQRELLEDIGAIHQYLQKPCEPEAIGRAVTRASELSGAIETEELRRVVAGVETLPVMSDTLRELCDALGDERTTVPEVAAIIERDVGLAAKIMQLVNSAFFGLARHVCSVNDAVVLIGLQNVRTLAVTTKVFVALSEEGDTGPSVDRVWRASVEIGRRASALARQAGASSETRELASVAGMMSLVGRGVLLQTMPERFDAAQKVAASEGVSLLEAEHREFGATQDAVGAYALGLWAFEDAVVESVARQSAPELSGVESAEHPLVYIHLARALGNGGPLAEKVAVSVDWVKRVGVSGLISHDERSAA